MDIAKPSRDLVEDSFKDPKRDLNVNLGRHSAFTKPRRER